MSGQNKDSKFKATGTGIDPTPRGQSFFRYTVDDLLPVLESLRDGDSVYTYAADYMSLGARIAFHGVDKDHICVDVQYSACAYVGDIPMSQLRHHLVNYKDIIQRPEDYGLEYEE